MELFEKCRQCGEPVVITNTKMTTIKKYCSRACRDAWWDDQRNTGMTWGTWCDARFGKMEPLVLAETECAWLAGVIDGEGCIGIRRERRARNRSGWRYAATLEVSGTHAGFIKRIADCMQDTVQGAQRNGSSDRNKPLYRTRVGNRGVRRVLDAVRPYLIIKGEQADTVLKFLTKMENAPCRTEYLHPEFEVLYQRMKMLNKRGV